LIRVSEGIPALSRVEEYMYERPAIEDFGSLAELTAGSQDGDFTDKAFPILTPKRLLTFS
jgi:hypothetical protein